MKIEYPVPRTDGIECHVPFEVTQETIDELCSKGVYSDWMDSMRILLSRYAAAHRFDKPPEE